MLSRRSLGVLNIAAILVICGAVIWIMRFPPVAGRPAGSLAVAAVAAPVEIPGEGSGVTMGAPETAERPGNGSRTEPLELLPASGSMAAGGSVSASDPGWLDRAAARTQIPGRALRAYVESSRAANEAIPGCGISWNTLAAIGWIESGHGTHGGGELTPAGLASRPIIGPSLDGDGFAAIPDTDSGEWDGDSVWDHAVGPMQFIPATWKLAGRDGNGDGFADPRNIDDASLSAAFYLCGGGRDLTSAHGWTEGVLSYNQSDLYVRQVRDKANAYAVMSAES